MHVFIVAGEESGDQLGAALMRALRGLAQAPIRFSGVGGAAMAAEGLTSLFPLKELALVGFVDVVLGLPRARRRIGQTVGAVLAADPDVLVIVDSPEFTHRVAFRVRRVAPRLPIIDYVSPSVWAWRPRRARAMRRYVDHVLALLPFEPDAHARLGGPPCSYVGHPLAERIADFRPNAEEAQRRMSDPPVLLVLPGSRRTEIRHLLAPFASAVDRVRAATGALDIVLPTLPRLADEIRAATASWPQQPRIVTDRSEKYAAFRIARAALAASGTVTLELALAGVPTVAAYRVTALEAAILRRMIQVPSVILANLVLGENVVPEFLQEACTPERLSAALIRLLADSPERRRQCDAFARLDTILQIDGASPSERAAAIVLHAAGGNTMPQRQTQA